MPPAPELNPNNMEREVDDIKVQYHPNSHCQDAYFRFAEYTSSLPKAESLPVDPEPWKPFRSRLDFEFAELMHETNMNTHHKEVLIQLVQKCIADPKLFTLNNVKDLEKVWDAASYRTDSVSNIAA